MLNYKIIRWYHRNYNWQHWFVFLWLHKLRKISVILFNLKQAQYLCFTATSYIGLYLSRSININANFTSIQMHKNRPRLQTCSMIMKCVCLQGFRLYIRKLLFAKAVYIVKTRGEQSTLHKYQSSIQRRRKVSLKYVTYSKIFPLFLSCYSI